MINITVYTKDDYVIGYQVSGHAGLAPRGQDIVCAAVSALAQTGLLALGELLQVEPEYRVDSGFLFCRLGAVPEDKLKDSSLILKTMYLGFREIEKLHGDYVKVICKEVQENDDV